MKLPCICLDFAKKYWALAVLRNRVLHDFNARTPKIPGKVANFAHKYLGNTAVIRCFSVVLKEDRNNKL